MTVPVSTKEQIVLTAERLFAQHGVDGVSLRQIGTAAGNANNSAVQYHFGSKDRLIEAIFAHRLPGLHELRSRMVARQQPDTLRAWVECQVLTVLDFSEQPDSHYLAFLMMMRQYQRRDIFERLPEQSRRSIQEFHDRLGSLLTHLAEPVRSHRIAQANAFIVHAAADRERALGMGNPVLPFTVEATDLTDSMVGFLQAASTATTELPADHTATAWPAFF